MLVLSKHHKNKGVRKVSPLAAGGGTSNRESPTKHWLQGQPIKVTARQKHKKPNQALVKYAAHKTHRTAKKAFLSFSPKNEIFFTIIYVIEILHALCYTKKESFLKIVNNT